MPFATDLLRLARLAPIAAAMALAACASPPPPPPVVVVPAVPPAPPAPPREPPATPADLATRQVLAAHERLRQLPPGELAREQARLGDGSAGPQATVELAIVLGQSHNLADTARAMSLLDALLRSTAPEAAAWQPVARLLWARLGEQRRLEETIERQNQQARDSARRLDQLNDKLEALKAIERSLVTRPGAGPGAPVPPGAPPAPRLR